MSETPIENPQLDKLKRRIPGADPTILTDMLDDALAAILGYTGQAALPAGLKSAQVKLAATYYNGLGMEGQTAHSEGGVSISIGSIPEDMKAELSRYRLFKVGW